MKKKEMSLIVTRRLKKIKNGIKKIAETAAQEDIHQFRVDVKKLRAIVRFIRAGLPADKKLKLPKALKNFYKTIGFIRLVQLQKENIVKTLNKEDHHIPNTYFNQLSSESREQLMYADDFMRGKTIAKIKTGRLTKNIPGKLSRPAKMGYMRGELISLKCMLKLVERNEDLVHPIRKQLKDILYTWRYSHKQSSNLLPSFLDSKKKISQITELLGRYVDLDTGLSLLGPDRLDKIFDENEKILLINIKDKWLTEKQDILIQFRNSR